MTQQTRTIAESNNFIVLDKYVTEWEASDRYQSESELEHELIQDLRNQGYEFVPDLTSQSAMLANFINILGLTLSVIFSIGAVIGAAITMYAAVASRTGEIGTLRALGFRKSSVLLAFMVESLLLSLLGGLAGLAAASLMQVFTISTMNWQSFSELAFSFRLTLPIAVKTLLFALGMGLVGGFMPAARAARMNIVSALRES